MTTWAFARLNHDGLTGAASACAREVAASLDAHTLATIALSLVRLGCTDSRALKALARAARSRIGEFNPQDLDDVASAFAQLGRRRLT